MYECLKFDYIRNGLKYLIKRFEIKELFIPYYLCDVIRHSVIEENCKPLFYHIDDNFMPDKEFPEDKYILYPNYFGVCDNNIKVLVNKYPKIITDNAHSFYSKPSGFASLYAEHKFLPVKEGAYLYIKKEGTPSQTTEYPSQNMQTKTKFEELHKKYSKTNMLKLSPENAESPFCYPYLARSEEEADELADRLTNQGLTIYRYWNNLPQNYNEYKFYRRLVPIPLI